MDKLPTVIATSVVRSTHQGESHGGVYLIDLNSGQYDQVIDWNDDSINWEGRGGTVVCAGLHSITIKFSSPPATRFLFMTPLSTASILTGINTCSAVTKSAAMKIRFILPRPI